MYATTPSSHATRLSSYCGLVVALAACASDGAPAQPAAGSAGGRAGQAGAFAGNAGGGTAGSAAVGGSNAPLAGTGRAGSSAAGGTASAGRAGSAARAGSAGLAAVGGAGSSAGTGGSGVALEHFSFFVTSLEGMQRLSKSQNGFGGDLRYGQADGLSGADKICNDLAEHSMPGASKKGWRAFLSVASGSDGKPVHAIDRVGSGPWYDRQGRLVAMTKTALANTRPQGADAAILNDLPNEYGIPNHRPDPAQPEVDNHHVLTGSDTSGKLYQNKVDGTCLNWTSTESTAGKPQVGVSWIAGNRTHWISQFSEGGCGAKVSVVEMGGPTGEAVVGSGGGYGGIYCFALLP